MTLSLTVQEITTPEALEALSHEWSDLAARDPHATLFQHPEWLLPWWRHLGRGRLLTLAVRAEDRLAGLAPLFVAPYFGLPLRRIAFLGTGHTDYLGVLAEPALREGAAAAVLDHLRDRRARWHFCDFQQLREGSPLLSASAPAGVHSQAYPQEVCPALSLPDDPAAVAAALPPRLAKKLRYYRRRLAREPGAGIETATAGNLDEHLEALFRLHAARWRRRRLPGAFAGARVRAFHREAAARALECGWLRLHGLRVSGQIRASLYCFVQGGRGYYYSGGFDPALGALSPGALLIGHALEDAARHGAREFDFLRGGEAYKYGWGAADRVNSRRLLWRESFPACVAPAVVALERRAELGLKRLARNLAEAERRRRLGAG